MEKVSLNYFQVTHFLTKLNNDAPLWAHNIEKQRYDDTIKRLEKEAGEFVFTYDIIM